MSAVELKTKGNRESFGDPKRAISRIEELALEGFTVKVTTDDTSESYRFRELLFLHSEDLETLRAVEKKYDGTFQSVTKNTICYEFICFK